MSRRFRWPWRSRPEIVTEVDEELAFHLEMRAAELIRSGLTRDQAVARAKQEFGDLETTRRYCQAQEQGIERRRRLGDRLLDFRGDLVATWRGWRRTPIAAAVTLGSLALAIGAAAAVFSVVDGVLFKALPYHDADRVVAVYQWESRKALLERPSPGNLLDWQERLTGVEIAGAEPFGYTLTSGDVAVGLSAYLVGEGFFRILGVQMLHGRDFRSEEHQFGRESLVILSHSVWLDRFGGDPSVVGRQIQLDGAPFQVVGVLPPRIEYPEQRALYTPKVFRPDEREARARTYFRAVGRLRPGVTLAQARAEIETVTRQLAAEYPRPNANVVGRLVPVAEDIAGKVYPSMIVMLAAVGLVMLVACINVAGLLVTRSAYRRGEHALRLALGAGRARLTRMAWLEGLVLGLLGALGGAGVAAVGIRLVIRFAPADLPRVSAIALDWRAVAVLVALGVLTAVVCTVLPARVATSAVDADVFRQRAFSGGRLARRTGRMLVVAEVGLAVTLLFAAGLLGRSFLKLTNQELGYRTDGRVLATVHVWDRYPSLPQLVGYVDRVVAELETIPGVKRAAAANALPLSAVGSEMDPPFLVEGEPPPLPGQEPTARLTIATPGYFEVLGIPLRSGRLFDRSDDARGRPVIVVSELMASRIWPGQDPLGRAIMVRARDSTLRRLEVVGVVGDTRFAGHADRAIAEYYVPLAQRNFGSLTFVVDAGNASGVGVDAIQAALARVDASVVASAVEAMDRLISGTLATRTFILSTTGVFAVVAILLAAVGLYGLLSFVVAERLREIGIRMALGAARRDVLRMVTLQGVGLAVIGLGAGLAGAMTIRQFLASQLWGIDPTDPVTLVSCAALVMIIALVASAIPAWRAGRVDPAESLRRE